MPDDVTQRPDEDTPTPTPRAWTPLPQWHCAHCQRRVVSRAPWQTPPLCRSCRARVTAESRDRASVSA
jgi:hypothetical protein